MGCLYNSLTKEDNATLLTYQKGFEMEVNGETKVMAPLMCKVIMRLATLDGNATDTKGGVLDEQVFKGTKAGQSFLSTK